jgi:hypothetical protein
VAEVGDTKSPPETECVGDHGKVRRFFVIWFAFAA